MSASFSISGGYASDLSGRDCPVYFPDMCDYNALDNPSIPRAKVYDKTYEEELRELRAQVAEDQTQVTCTNPDQIDFGAEAPGKANDVQPGTKENEDHAKIGMC